MVKKESDSGNTLTNMDKGLEQVKLIYDTKKQGNGCLWEDEGED